MKKPTPLNPAYLIERADSQACSPIYFDMSRINYWTTQHDKASRFKTKDDAEKVAKMIIPHIETRIAQHEWS